MAVLIWLLDLIQIALIILRLFSVIHLPWLIVISPTIFALMWFLILMRYHDKIRQMVEKVQALRQRARERREFSFVMNRDCGCVFCKRFMSDDDPFHRYLISPEEQHFMEYDKETDKMYAICEWHKTILWKWADAKKQREMLDYLHDYLKNAQKPF